MLLLLLETSVTAASLLITLKKGDEAPKKIKMVFLILEVEKTSISNKNA